MRRTITTVYQLRVTLEESDPPVWRRLLVPADMRLPQLHQVLQIAFDWTDSHLHAFSSDGQEYGPLSEDAVVQDERRVRLADLLTAPGERLDYEYDFGDEWRHAVVLEAVLPAEPDGRYPHCLAGARSAPPEDCGGPRGYADLLRSCADPGHPGFRELREWLGPGFDAEALDLGRVNRRLHRRRG